MEIKTRPDIGRDLVSGDNVVIDTGSALVTASPDRFATFGASVPQTTQTITSSPATATARFIVLDDDGHTSGSPGSLVMPPITEGAWHVICTPYEDVHYLVTADAGDAETLSLTIDSSIMRQQMIFMFAAESEGALRWQYDRTGYYITTIFTALTALGNAGVGVQVISGTSDTVTGALDVYVTNASAAVAVTLPDAVATRRIRLHKANAATTQTITLVRSAGDTASGTINGVAASFDLTWTSLLAGTERLSVDIGSSAPLTWHVESGVPSMATYLASLGGVAGTLAVTTVPALEAGTVPSANILRTTTAGPHTIGATIGHVCQAYAGAMTYTMPAATVGRRVRFLKETTNAGQITLQRAGSDTIHGSASNYVLDGSAYVTSATTFRKAWDLVCYVAGDWQVC